MSDEIDGTYKILSFEKRSPPIGVNLTLPSGQSVYVNAPVDKWVIIKVGKDTYSLGVGGYGYAGVVDGKVFASTFAEQASKWRITHRETKDAYTRQTPFRFDCIRTADLSPPDQYRSGGQARLWVDHPKWRRREC